MQTCIFSIQTIYADPGLQLGDTAILNGLYETPVDKKEWNIRPSLLTFTILNPFVCFPHCFVHKFTNNPQQYEAQENSHCDQ